MDLTEIWCGAVFFLSSPTVSGLHQFTCSERRKAVFCLCFRSWHQCFTARQIDRGKQVWEKCCGCWSPLGTWTPAVYRLERKSGTSSMVHISPWCICTLAGRGKQDGRYCSPVLCLRLVDGWWEPGLHGYVTEEDVFFLIVRENEEGSESQSSL